MASAPSPGPRPVLLGIRDAAVEEGSRCSWDTSKAGATPDCVPGITMQYPHCTLCCDPLIHLVQVYCPLEGSPYHRTINVLACLRPECWGRSDSWKVLRSQYRETEEKQGTTSETAEEVSVTTRDWCDEADDWGVAEEPDAPGLSLRLDEPPSTAADAEIAAQATRLEGLNLLEVPVGGGLVTLTPVPSFQPFYIGVVDEDDYTEQTRFAHEEKLLKEYQRREGVDVEQLASSSCEDGGRAETYEKTKVRHGDRTFVKFLKRISRCPQQILRYSWSGLPLFLSSPAVGFQSAVPACRICGSRRVFEFQLMPALINLLKSASSEEVSVEFGTVLIYTCERSCWEPSNQTPREERAFVQGDPDQHFFR
ncbi:programmed cell death protein 2-like isoform X2 [Heptranchias perlo]|uniref:programmed cell death protein 2-like isoform X2 n=1 Tax=Heptranchias perlo TaxID=212740 RepID=UPI0035597E53